MIKVVLDVSAGSRAGGDRGLGRYLESVREANASLGHDVEEIQFSMGERRLSEFRPLLPRALRIRAARADIFHAISPYYGAPWSRNQVVSVLDVIPLDVGRYSRTGLKRAVFHRLAAQAQAIATLSEHAKLRIVERMGVAESRVFVAPLPPALVAPTEPGRLALPPRYVAAMADVRTADPRKRVEWLEGVAEELYRRGIPLVIAGGGTDEDRHRFTGALVLGRIGDSALAEMLSRARAFVYTSAYEGQGMPPLEAISMGTPVIAMRNTAIPEVVGDAGILLDEDLPPQQAAQGPHRSDDPPVKRLVDATQQLFEDEAMQRRLSAACAAQAQRFTRERFREGLVKAYDMARGVT